MGTKTSSILFYFALLSGCCFLQCQSNTAAPDLEDEPMHWLEQGTRKIPAKVEASILQYPNYYQIVIAGREEGNEGLLLLIIAQKDKVLMEHSLSNRRTKMGIPYERMSIKQNVLVNNMLDVYISEACRPSSGKIKITSFDPKTFLISGYFESKLCTTGKLGSLEEKNVQDGHFKNIKMSYFDKR